MDSQKIKKIIINLLIVFLIFFVDRISKIYILGIAETEAGVDIYINPFLNFVLFWNKGIGFGLLSFDQLQLYNLVTILIIGIIVIIIFIIYKITDYRIYFYSMILGGALGNLFDRLYYSAVPDFIDFHINDFHWFIFNIADIFISLGVICLIFAEIIFKKKLNNE